MAWFSIGLLQTVCYYNVFVLPIVAKNKAASIIGKENPSLHLVMLNMSQSDNMSGAFFFCDFFSCQLSASANTIF